MSKNFILWRAIKKYAAKKFRKYCDIDLPNRKSQKVLFVYLFWFMVFMCFFKLEIYYNLFSQSNKC